MKSRIRKKKWKQGIKAMTSQFDCLKMKKIFTYSRGYYLYDFGQSGYNLSLKIKGIEDFKFGIWKNGNKYNFFGSFIPYIDKFKPSYSDIEWNKVEDMIEWIKKASNPTFLKNFLLEKYKDYDESEEEFYKGLQEQKEYKNDFRLRNGMNKDIWDSLSKDFQHYINECDEHFLVIWRKSICYDTLYDVWLYVSSKIEREGLNIKIDNFNKRMRELKSFVGTNDILAKLNKYNSKKYHYRANKGNINNLKKIFGY